MQIRDVAESAGLPAKTIRYYEEIGLVHPERRENGYRDYSDEDIHRLRFLQRARGLGFSIEDCRALLSLYDEKGRESADVRAIAEAHLEEIDRKIRELQSLRGTLAHLVRACHGDDRPDCPILDDLAGGSQ
ncbi:MULTISPECIES: Cu(I)-responsive transcriptional regulator [Nisaea]|jgi:Cu(I)-responsive transcriptional regulator|uniref:Cu(I)-responsive transcriptional regulator n=1 Tax=Nisaea TaxID=390876 RepID=UPI0018667B87|nr:MULTISPECIES: Cu(I)-responsive transcriptional regulator [Nisaea]MBO6560659.1 Cu(I)-responsive transcriptional regulator [Nisaea sp.]